MVLLHVVQKKGWLAYIVRSIFLVVTAFYELFDRRTAVLTGEAAEAFPGTQEHTWDIKSSLLFTLFGATKALALLSRTHDRQIVCLTMGIGTQG